ncbi:MAG TPA: PQQ-binding-like beta-propeller repeat protein, partial [Streptosporangiaceae bacterium]
MSWTYRCVAAGAILTAGLLGPAVTATAATPQAVSTMTTLSASSTSVIQNSPVTFTATVSAASGTPAGSVIFTDKSNGSILDKVTLSHGSATFVTAALAPGSRAIAARYTGNASFAPSTSAKRGVSVTTSGSEATAYQVDSRHDGDQPASLSVSTLARKWHVSPGGSASGAVSYPVAAAGQVFVTVANQGSYGTRLFALSARTGATEWSAGLGGLYYFSALTYDGRTVFALNYDGVLTAFAAATGHELWSAQMPGQSAFTAPPTAYDGVVYVSGAGIGGTVYAVSEADGAVRWQRPVMNGDESSPAVDDSGAYVSYVCNQDYRFRLGGALAWHHQTGCEGGGGSTPLLRGGSLYARGSYPDTAVILSAASGASTGSFASLTAPADNGTDLFTMQNGDLVAVDKSGSPDRWQFGTGSLVTAPVVSGGIVFAGSSSGTVYGVSASTGKKV